MTARRYEKPLAWVLWGLLYAALAAGLYLIKGVLLPFLAAALIAYVFNPWVNRMERWRVPRPAGTLVTLMVITGLLALLVLGLAPVVEHQVHTLMDRLPDALARAKATLLPELAARLGVETSAGAWLDALSGRIAQFPDLARSGSGLLAWLASGTVGLVGWLLTLAVMPVLVFYFLMDFPRIGAWLIRLPSAAQRQMLVPRLARIDHLVGAYLRGQLMVAALLAVLYSAGLSLVGIEAPVAIGILAGFGNLVPYLGFVAGITLAGSVAFLTYFDLLHPLYVLAVFAVVQGLEGSIISPRLVGGVVGLHPLAVIFALFVGGGVFGFFGVLLAIPAAIAVKVMLEARAEG